MWNWFLVPEIQEGGGGVLTVFPDNLRLKKPGLDRVKQTIRMLNWNSNLGNDLNWSGEELNEFWKQREKQSHFCRLKISVYLLNHLVRTSILSPLLCQPLQFRVHCWFSAAIANLWWAFRWKKKLKKLKKWNWGDLLLKIGKQTFVYLFMLALEKTCSKFNTDSEYICFQQENISTHRNIHEKRRTSICLCRYLHIKHCRSSRSQMFFKTDVLKNFAIFKGKHLCRSLFLIKLQTCRSATLFKSDSNTFVLL